MSRAVSSFTGYWGLILSVGVLIGIGCSDPDRTSGDRLGKQGTGEIRYQSVPVEGGGRLEGQVLLGGRIPPLRTIEVTRRSDQTVCGTETDSRRVRVGMGGEVMDAVVTLVGIRTGKPLDTLQAGAVNQVDCHFIPHLLIHPAGAPLWLRNEDPMLHHVLASTSGGGGLFNLSLPRRGMEISRSLPDSGWVDLGCDLHPWMTAGIWITPHPYAVATDETGAFALEEIPPGEHRVKAWHPVLGELEKAVVVEPEKTTRVILSLPGIE